MLDSKPSVMKATLLSLGLITMVVTQACVHEPSRNPVGVFTSVQGQAVVIHADDSEPIAIRSHNGVHSEDIIETKQGSRAKAWLQDDTLLSVGEESRVELSMQSYDPAGENRSTVIRLTRGKVRALIGRPLVGTRSKFEIHTATALVAARGTYFVVWLEEGRSNFPPGTTGVVNIGKQGWVAFKSGGHTANVLPGQFSIALPEMAPRTPRDVARHLLAEVSSAITGTEIKDIMTAEKPSEVVRAIGDRMNRELGIPVSTSASESDEDDTPPAVISGAVSRAGQPGGTPVSDGADTETSPTNPGPTPTMPAPGPIPGPVPSPPSAPIPVLPSVPSPTPTPVISPPSTPIPLLPSIPSPITSPLR